VNANAGHANQVRDRASYVLILEWLDPADEQTGRLLHDWHSRIGRRSELVICGSARDSDVQLALETM
jgi:hypothetical protein